MVKFALINISTRLIESIVVPSSPAQFQDGDVLGEFIAMEVQSYISDEQLRATRHLNADGKLFIHAPKQHDSDSWDVIKMMWVMDLDKIKRSEYDKLKFSLYQFITTECGFTGRKQINYTDTDCYLRLKKLEALAVGESFVFTNEEQAALAKVTQARKWKKTLFAERDRVKGLIFSAKNKQAVEDSVESMEYIIPGFVL